MGAKLIVQMDAKKTRLLTVKVSLLITSLIQVNTD